MTFIKELHLKTGYEAVDFLNPELFKAIDSFFYKCSIGNGIAMMDDIFLILDNYIINHFPEEESLMIKYDYPDYPYHKMQHDTFATLTAQLKEEFLTGNDKNKLLAKLNSFFIYWLYNHIKQSDQRMTTYLTSYHESALNIF